MAVLGLACTIHIEEGIRILSVPSPRPTQFVKSRD